MADERRGHVLDYWVGQTEIKLVRRTIVVGRMVYVWGSDGRRDRVWRWRALPEVRRFWRPRWRSHPGWRRCGLIRRAWAWAIWWLPQAVGCRSVVRYDKYRAGNDL